MKTSRQIAILDIIEKNDIETQEELADALRERGMLVTQATVSRDIKQMRLVKVMTPYRVYKYAVSDATQNEVTERFARMLRESVLSAVGSNNLVVVRTLNGSANVAAEALDSMHWPEVLGTIAGDNTVLVIGRSNEEVPAIIHRLHEIKK